MAATAGPLLKSSCGVAQCTENLRTLWRSWTQLPLEKQQREKFIQIEQIIRIEIQELQRELRWRQRQERGMCGEQCAKRGVELLNICAQQTLQALRGGKDIQAAARVAIRQLLRDQMVASGVTNNAQVAEKALIGCQWNVENAIRRIKNAEQVVVLDLCSDILSALDALELTKGDYPATVQHLRREKAMMASKQVEKLRAQNAQKIVGMGVCSDLAWAISVLELAGDDVLKAIQILKETSPAAAAIASPPAVVAASHPIAAPAPPISSASSHLSTASSRILDTKPISDFGILAPIPDMSKVPTLSFREAADRIAALCNHDEWGNAMFTAESAGESFVGLDPYGLTQDEISVFNLYSQEACGFYQKMNELLRSRNREDLKPFLPIIKLFVTGAQKLPRIADTVYRGVKEDLSDTLAPKKGRPVVWWHFTSCAREVQTLSNPQYLGTTGRRTFFYINAKNAVDISAFSVYPDEKEVILLPGTKYLVKEVNVGVLAADLTQVTLEEIGNLY